MYDLAVEIGAPIAVDDLRQEQAGDQKEVRHAERPGEGDDGMQPALLAGRLLDAERGMHHHHEDDAKPLRIVDPIDALTARRICRLYWTSHFGFHLCRIWMEALPLPLLIQVRCQGVD